MKALTIWQPWASLIAHGAKPYEFRGWTPPARLIGQRIAIHAGARKVRRDEVHWLVDAIRRGEPPCLHADLALDLLDRVALGDWPRSVVLCTAKLGQPLTGDTCAREFGLDIGGNDSDRDGTFNWGWPLSDVRHLSPPLAWRGAQGLFVIPDDLVTERET